MKKKTLFISISVAGLAAGALLLTFAGGNRNQPRVETAEKRIANKSDLIVQGEKYEKEGKFSEAKALYWKAIEDSSDNEIIREAEKRLYALNTEMLFSPIMTEDSRKYTVAKGDTLSGIAKKFGTTVELLKRSNRLTGDLIRPGMELKVSTARYSIVVDRSQNILILKSNDQVLKVYQVSTGKDDSTPLGNFKVINKLVDPTWYSSGAVLPPGSPKNILGSRWIGISSSEYGIHGTTQPETIGNHITAGCIRMVNEDVEELYSIITVGTEVAIIN